MSSERLNRENGTDLPELKLADPNPFSSLQIDLILGADKYGLCLLDGLQQGVLGTLTAQSTIFDWILSVLVVANRIERSIPLTVQQRITSEVLHEDLNL